MIETQIDELDRHDLAIDETRDVFVGPNIRALAIPSESERLKSQEVPGALERYILRKLFDVVPMRQEPTPVIIFFGLPFGKAESAEDRCFPRHRRRIRGKDHVRNFGGGR